MDSSETVSKHVHTGSCLCGGVRYTINGQVRDIINCHCSLCRKFHGHFGAYTAVKTRYLTINSNSNFLAWYSSMHNDAQRGFCVICGSSLFWKLASNDTISVAAGTLDQPTGLKTVTDIYVADKADYYHLDPQLQKLEKGL